MRIRSLGGFSRRGAGRISISLWTVSRSRAIPQEGSHRRGAEGESRGRKMVAILHRWSSSALNRAVVSAAPPACWVMQARARRRVSGKVQPRRAGVGNRDQARE